MCDLNAKSDLWSRNKTDNEEQELSELLNKFGLNILNDSWFTYF